MSDDVIDISIRERTDRLREAVKLGGGASAVVRRIGMPAATLNNYLAGRDMKVSALVALAEACEVSIEWLATGKGPVRASIMASSPSDSLNFPASQLAAPANFRALIMLLLACKETYQKGGITPSVADVLEWIGPLYEKFKVMQDGPVEIKPFEGEGSDARA